jgi:hypothetical protein
LKKFLSWKKILQIRNIFRVQFLVVLPHDKKRTKKAKHVLEGWLSWLKVPDSKSGDGAIHPGVRIPPLPPVSKLLRPLFIKDIAMNITLLKRGTTLHAKTTL